MNRWKPRAGWMLAIAALLTAATLAGSAWADIKGEKPIPWDQLAKMDYHSGKTPPELDKMLKSKSIRVAGYAIPVEVTDFDHIQNFILVPWKIGCCQGPPPDPNQIIEVTLKEGVSFDKLMDTVYILGQLSVIKDGNGEFGYALSKGEVFAPEFDI